MFKEFKEFAMRGNVVDMAVGIIIGAAFGSIVKSLVDDVLMPVIGLLIPGGEWRTIKIALTHNPDGSIANAIMLGSFLGSVIDFVIIATVVFMIVKALIKPAPVPPAPPTKKCPECLETIALEAKRCKYCTSPVTGAAKA